MTPRDRLKNVDFAELSVLIYKKYFRQTKFLQKIKNIIRPTYPNFKKHVTGNTHIFLFGLMYNIYIVHYIYKI